MTNRDIIEIFMMRITFKSFPLADFIQYNPFVALGILSTISEQSFAGLKFSPSVEEPV